MRLSAIQCDQRRRASTGSAQGGTHKAESFTFITTLLIRPVISISCENSRRTRVSGDTQSARGHRSGGQLIGSAGRCLVRQECAQVASRRCLAYVSSERNQRWRGVHPPNLAGEVRG